MKKKKTSKKIILILLIIILIILVLALLGVFLYDKIQANRIIAELTEIVYIFHQSEHEDVYIEGNVVIGTIRIDRLGIEYPIIEYRGLFSLDSAIAKHPGPNINELRKCSFVRAQHEKWTFL